MRRRQKAIKISPGDGEQAVGGRRRAVFLDRDGVINRMVYNSEFGLVDSPQNPEEFKLLPGVGEAIRLVNETGFLVVVVSNQPGVAKAKFTLDILEAMTQKMHDELAQAGAHLDGVYYCLHHPQAVVGSYRTTCTCRKPAPGLLIQAAEELNWWIDNPLAFNRKEHFFDARIFVDDAGRTIGSERKYTMNMAGSLACAMWMVGHDLGDKRLMEYAADQVINGISPHQHETGYFPYNTTHKYEMVDGIALDSNHYHGLTLQVLSGLLAYKFWQQQPKFVKMMQHGAKYMRDNLTFETGIVKHPPHIAAIRKSKYKRCPKAPFGSTVNSALVHTRIYKYLGDTEALTQAGKNLRWLYWNTPNFVPFSHCFREVVLMAWEGIHLKQKGSRDIKAVFIEQT